MWKSLGAIALLFATLGARGADITPTEARWLEGAWPVISHAKEIQLPLDIVVQPQNTAGLPPLAMAFVEGRCKLVLSMRGNPQAQSTLESLPADLHEAALELMAAHELGHCRRHLDGAWHGVPAGFVAAAAPAHLAPELAQAYADMQATRREEGFGDLVGLAWIQMKRPALYARLYAWLREERERDLIPGSHHDTLAWLDLARDGTALEGATLFDRPTALWRRGLGAGD
jgi:hypothetical protein